MREYDKKIRNSIIAFVSSVAIIGFTIAISYFAIYGAHGITLLGNKDKKAAAYAGASANTKQGAIVFLGDSITEMCNLETYYPSINAYNRGISGDTTTGMLKRLKTNVLDVTPSTLVFMGGTNDIGRKVAPEDIADNIQKIIIKTHETLPNCKIIIQSVYPVNTIRKPTFYSKTGCRTNEIINELNKLIMDICDEYDFVTYIDVNSSLKDKDGNLKNQYTVDGLHLTKAAYKQVAKIITPYIV